MCTYNNTTAGLSLRAGSHRDSGKDNSARVIEVIDETSEPTLVSDTHSHTRALIIIPPTLEYSSAYI